LSFAEIFGIRKPETLGYHMELFVWFYISLFQQNTDLWQTGRQTHDYSIYRVSMASHGKKLPSPPLRLVYAKFQVHGAVKENTAGDFHFSAAPQQ